MTERFFGFDHKQYIQTFFCEQGTLEYPLGSGRKAESLFSLSVALVEGPHWVHYFSLGKAHLLHLDDPSVEHYSLVSSQLQVNPTELFPQR